MWELALEVQVSNGRNHDGQTTRTNSGTGHWRQWGDASMMNLMKFILKQTIARKVIDSCYKVYQNCL